jgi:hypothetical protein
MDDESFEQLFVPVMDTIMERYQPDAIVLQSGGWQLVTPIDPLDSLWASWLTSGP